MDWRELAEALAASIDGQGPVRDRKALMVVIREKAAEEDGDVCTEGGGDDEAPTDPGFATPAA